MLPTEDLLVYVYVVIHDLILAGRSWSRPGQARLRPALMANCWPSPRSGAEDLLCTGQAPRDLLADKGFSRAFAAAQAARGTAVLARQEPARCHAPHPADRGDGLRRDPVLRGQVPGDRLEVVAHPDQVRDIAGEPAEAGHDLRLELHRAGFPGHVGALRVGHIPVRAAVD